MTIPTNALMISFFSCLLVIKKVDIKVIDTHLTGRDTRWMNIVRSVDLDQSPAFPGAIERLFNNIQNDIVAAAEAMPEDQFNFTPEKLHLKSGNFKGVRTFSGQIKHLATDNFAIWTPLTNEPLRGDITDVNGPKNIKTKTEIIKYLKDSFALGHRAISTLTGQNAMEMIEFRGRNLPRLDLAFYALTHSNEHYGQMVVYLRMCGITPPATMREKAYQ